MDRGAGSRTGAGLRTGSRSLTDRYAAAPRRSPDARSIGRGRTSAAPFRRRRVGPAGCARRSGPAAVRTAGLPGGLRGGLPGGAQPARLRGARPCSGSWSLRWRQVRVLRHSCVPVRLPRQCRWRAIRQTAAERRPRNRRAPRVLRSPTARRAPPARRRERWARRHPRRVFGPMRQAVRSRPGFRSQFGGPGPGLAGLRQGGSHGSGRWPPRRSR